MRLYGRQAEQRAIDSLLAGAWEGRSAAVVVRGEAGIGKTALLDYAAAAADGMLVLRAVGIETEAELAFAGLQPVAAAGPWPYRGATANLSRYWA